MGWKFWAPVDEPDKIERRTRELDTRKARQGHELSLAELKDERTDFRSEIRERRADRREARALSRLNRQARVSGVRASVTHDLWNSGEIRALRVMRIRKIGLLTLLPVLLAFAGWSTIGVHAGVVKLLGAAPGSSYDRGAWFVEPAIIVIVAGIIIGRAALRSAGGDLDWRATVIEWGMLSGSLALNLAGAWPEGGFLEGAAATVAHSIGPIGVMVTAFMISIIDDAVSNAKPFEGRPRLADAVVEVGVSRVVSPEVSQAAVPEKRPVSRPKTVPAVRPKASQDAVPAPVPPVIPEVSRTVVPALSQSDQFEKVVTAWERAREEGRPCSVRAIASLTGVSKTSVGRILQPYTAKANAEESGN